MFGRARTRLCLTPLRSRIRKHNRLAYSLHSNPAKNEWLWSLVVRPGPVTSSHHKHHTDTTDTSNTEDFDDFSDFQSELDTWLAK